MANTAIFEKLVKNQMRRIHEWNNSSVGAESDGSQISESRDYTLASEIHSLVISLLNLVKFMKGGSTYAEDGFFKTEHNTERILLEVTDTVRRMKETLSHYQDDICIPRLHAKQLDLQKQKEEMTYIVDCLCTGNTQSLAGFAINSIDDIMSRVEMFSSTGTEIGMLQGETSHLTTDVNDIIDLIQDLMTYITSDAEMDRSSDVGEATSEVSMRRLVSFSRLDSRSDRCQEPCVPNCTLGMIGYVTPNVKQRSRMSSKHNALYKNDLSKFDPGSSMATRVNNAYDVRPQDAQTDDISEDRVFNTSSNHHAHAGYSESLNRVRHNSNETRFVSESFSTGRCGIAATRGRIATNRCGIVTNRCEIAINRGIGIRRCGIATNRCGIAINTCGIATSNMYNEEDILFKIDQLGDIIHEAEDAEDTPQKEWNMRGGVIEGAQQKGGKLEETTQEVVKIEDTTQKGCVIEDNIQKGEEIEDTLQKRGIINKEPIMQKSESADQNINRITMAKKPLVTSEIYSTETRNKTHTQERQNKQQQHQAIAYSIEKDDATIQMTSSVLSREQQDDRSLLSNQNDAKIRGSVAKCSNKPNGGTITNAYCVDDCQSDATQTTFVSRATEKCFKCVTRTFTGLSWVIRICLVFAVVLIVWNYLSPGDVFISIDALQDILSPVIEFGQLGEPVY